ncbi:pseudouridine kinase [Tumebacillus sp. BK434]|uniref:carbohydrate kinase family protein n=1 Tax=Tumebacillus sp. BK434 TaxID=2512169 RepID=UPI0010F3848E|nr:carbohydrate kinase family protein [Tumebacillus sp. BK434]TCP53943.1 pseudouridine kinase [Tumebacillus sp. BK434]
MAITVIGTVFVDIKGYANGKVNSDTKNVGHVEFAHGGVGRNVAEAIGRAGGSVEFISSVSNTAQGADVAARLESIGIKTSRMVKTDNGMGQWLAILDGTGSLVASVSEKPDLSKLEDLLLRQGEEIVKNSDAVVVELDLHDLVVQAIFAWAKQYDVPVYGIVGNLDVLMGKRSLINDMAMFICNQQEVEEVYGISITSIEEAKLAARDLTAGGLKTSVITMGAEGCVFYNRLTDEFGYVPVVPTTVIDTTGAGDSFFAGTVFGLAHGHLLQQAVECGTHLASWTIASKEAVDPQISRHVQNHPLFQGDVVLK